MLRGCHIQAASAVADYDRDDFAVHAEAVGIGAANLLGEPRDFVVGNQVDGATAEAAPHETSAGDAEAAGLVDEEVEFGAADLVVVAQPIVGEIHLATHLGVVVVLQSLADGLHAVGFAENIASAAVVLVGECGAECFELLPGAVAQRCHPCGGSHALAGGAAVVVGRSHQLVFHAAVDQQEAIAIWIPREILIFAAAAVESHEAPLAAVHGGELVHDTAFDAYISMLCGLTDACHCHAVQMAVKEVVEGEGEAAFERCRRAHAGAEGHVAPIDGVETSHLYACRLQFAHHAVEVHGGHRTLPFSLDGEAKSQLEVGSVGVDGICAIGADDSSNALCHSAGEDESAVVVGVFADEVDATRGAEGYSFAAEAGGENNLQMLGVYHKLFGFHELEDGGALELLAGEQTTCRFRPKVVGGVGILLSLEAYGATTRILGAAATGYAVEEVARVELQAWCCGVEVHGDAAVLTLQGGCGSVQARMVEDEVLVVAAADYQLGVVALDVATDGFG